MSRYFRNIRMLKLCHLLLCTAAVLFVSWGLLAPNPLRAVNGTSFAFLSDIDDILIHLVVFLTFTVLTVSLVRNQRDPLRQLVATFVLAHAVTTEFLQAWIPSRTCDPLDMMANIVGIMLGLRLLEWLRNQRHTCGRLCCPPGLSDNGFPRPESDTGP